MAVVTVDLNLQELDKLVLALGASSRGDMIRKALGFLSLAESKSSMRIVSIGEGENAVRVLLR